MLDTAALADPEVRRAVVTARDVPAGLGDMDASLYLLFKAIRERSTVALSGESADEVFGGYKWFHQPEIRAADTFPWLAAIYQRFGNARSVLDRRAAGALDWRLHRRRLPDRDRRGRATARRGRHRVPDARVSATCT